MSNDPEHPVHRLAAALSHLVRRLPALVVVAAVALTVLFAAVSSQVEVATGNEGFAPDNPEIVASETIADRFGNDEAVVQVLVSGPDVVSADGLAAAEAIDTALATSPVGEHLSARPDRPAIVTWIDPVRRALAQQAGPSTATPTTDAGPATIDDDTVEATFTRALDGLASDERALARGLLPDDDGTDTGLVLVFLDVDRVVPDGVDRSEEFDALVAAQTDLVEVLEATELPTGYDAEAFSFPLLFSVFDQFEAEIARLFAGAFLIILVVLGFVYWLRPGLGLGRLGAGRRTAADIALTLAAIVMAIVWMQGAGVLLGPGYAGVVGPLTDIAQVVPILLVGLGVDYAIHLTSRYREEVAAGLDVSRSVDRAVGSVGVALALATATTAVGFLTNVFNPVPALRDFGILAAVGIVASFLLMLTFVPAVRLLLDRRAERLGRLPQQALGRTGQRLLPDLMARTAVLAERVPAATLVVTVVIGGVLGVWGLSRLETSFSATQFVSDDSPLVATHDTIVERFGGGFGETTDVLLTGDVATPAVHNATARVQDDLADLDDVESADGHAQARSPVSLVGRLAGLGPDGVPRSPDVAEAAAAAGLREDLTVADDADVAALYDRLFDAAPAEAAEVLARGGDGGYELARVDLRTTAGEEGAGLLAADLDAVFAPVVAAGVTAVATSQEIINDVTLSALAGSQVSSMVTALLAATLLLTAVFWIRHRRPGLGVVTLAPVALVVMWTFATMAATGVPLGPVTATIAALAIGIGVPYTIHVTNRFQEDLRRDDDPVRAIRSTLRHTGGALAGSAFTTLAGFGVLVTSSLAPFRQLGQVTVYAIGFALLAATLVLPSLLVLWDRWHDRRRRPGRVVRARPDYPTVRSSATAASRPGATSTSRRSLRPSGNVHRNVHGIE